MTDAPTTATRTPTPVERTVPTTTILAAHDDHRVRALLQDLRRDPHEHVIEVADADAALALARTLRPDCVLVDPALPGLHARLFLEQLQRDSRTRSLPVIMLTASEGSPDAVEQALGDGALDYIVRPGSSALVAARVHGAIRRARLLPDPGNVRTDFLAMLVHDLRTPLTVIQGYLDLLESGPSCPNGEPPQRYLRSMLACCAQMAGLVDEILDLYKLDAGRFIGEPRPLDMAAFVSNVVARFAPAARQRGIALEAEGVRRPLHVLADAGRLDQVVMNLLGNALKFTPDGGAVAVTVRAVDADVEVAVTDSGSGISAAEALLLFERFGQAEQGRRSRVAGTGLGLHICRRIIEAHGGRIWVESEPGRGARFAFRLRRLDDAGGRGVVSAEF
jgi:signal transduction histidine kinase